MTQHYEEAYPPVETNASILTIIMVSLVILIIFVCFVLPIFILGCKHRDLFEPGLHNERFNRRRASVVLRLFGVNHGNDMNAGENEETQQRPTITGISITVPDSVDIASTTPADSVEITSTRMSIPTV